MLEAYQKVGMNYKVKDKRLVGGLGQLQVLEGVPRRWPLARLTFPLRMVIAQLDRVLAGCCWKVLIFKPRPSKSLRLLCEASKGSTLLLAGWLAEKIAFMLREITFHSSQKLYDDETIHLLCANYWLLPIYQELLHTATGTMSPVRANGSGLVVDWQKSLPTRNLSKLKPSTRMSRPKLT